MEGGEGGCHPYLSPFNGMSPATFSLVRGLQPPPSLPDAACVSDLCISLSTPGIFSQGPGPMDIFGLTLGSDEPAVPGQEIANEEEGTYP